MREAGDSFDEVVPARDFKNIRIHGWVGFPIQKDRPFGLVFRTRRTTSMEAPSAAPPSSLRPIVRRVGWCLELDSW
ncbi:hypothetical protein V6N13_026785 [Hibiscus sabdariffa]|uniref:Uncharacterized protein n=1 Tax=Hibiscus sabdariffa TaxID=183260 RepID=A0ABR2B034_9ROSI